MIVATIDNTDYGCLSTDTEGFFDLVYFAYRSGANLDLVKGIVTGRVPHQDFTFNAVVDGDIDASVNFDNHTSRFGSSEFNNLELPKDLNPYPPFIKDLRGYYSEWVDAQNRGETSEDDEASYNGNTYESEFSDGAANLMGSMIKGSKDHYFIMDIDYPAWVVPSSTPGHFHLFIQKRLSHESMEHAVLGLSASGLIADGNVKQWTDTGQVYLRTPGTKKGEAPKRETPTLPDLQDILALPFDDVMGFTMEHGTYKNDNPQPRSVVF